MHSIFSTITPKARFSAQLAFSGCDDNSSAHIPGCSQLTQVVHTLIRSSSEMYPLPVGSRIPNTCLMGKSLASSRVRPTMRSPSLLMKHESCPRRGGHGKHKGQQYRRLCVRADFANIEYVLRGSEALVEYTCIGFVQHLQHARRLTDVQFVLTTSFLLRDKEI